MLKIKWYYILLFVFLINLLALSTFGISFDYSAISMNVIDFITISFVISSLITLGYIFKWKLYLYVLSGSNFVAIVYMIYKYILADYSWSVLVPIIGYYIILGIGLIVAVIIHLIDVLIKRKK
jgi:hypothetical protein